MTQTVRKKRKKRYRIRWGNLAAAALVLFAVLGLLIVGIRAMILNLRPAELEISDPYDGLTPEAALELYAFRHSLSVSDYPEELQELYAANPDAANFVLNYPFLKDKTFPIDLSDEIGKDGVPLLMQWDKRWGYQEYAGELFGLAGCGPTCLSMAALEILEDETLTPDAVAKFAIDNGYATEGSGSLWTLISEGGTTLGMNVSTLPLGESVMTDALNEGKLVIAIMGEGVFTTSGHFILFTGVDKDGKFIVNDPNSCQKSARTWDYDEFYDQVLNLWALS